MIRYGTVHSNQRQENTQSCIERRRILFYRHLHELHHTCNHSDEEDETEVAQIDALNETVGT